MSFIKCPFFNGSAFKKKSSIRSPNPRTITTKQTSIPKIATIPSFGNDKKPIEIGNENAMHKNPTSTNIWIITIKTEPTRFTLLHFTHEIIDNTL